MKRSLSQANITKDPLHSNGYMHLKNVIDIPDNVINEIIAQSNKRATIIFNHHQNRPKNDHKRKQVTISMKKSFMNDFIKNVNNYLTKNVNSNLTISKWVGIYSLPGCGEQAAHCDYTPSDITANINDELIPLGVLVAIMPDTKINVWPQSNEIHKYKKAGARKIGKVTINMEPGDIFIFRGDTVHAGSNYTHSNYRLHAYMDSPLVLRWPNRTWLINKHADDFIKNMIIV